MNGMKRAGAVDHRSAGTDPAHTDAERADRWRLQHLRAGVARGDPGGFGPLGINASVAEPEDAPGSDSGARLGVQVRPLPDVPRWCNT